MSDVKIKIELSEKDRPITKTKFGHFYRIQGKSCCHDGVLALVSYGEVVFFDKNGDITYAIGTEYLMVKYEILEDVTEKITLKVN